MAKLITASIDLTMLDKKRFKEMTRKNGNKAIFCDLILVETPGGQYGDWMVKQQCSKEERAQKKEMPIIGNGKNVGGMSRQSERAETTIAADDEIPL